MDNEELGFGLFDVLDTIEGIGVDGMMLFLKFFS